MMCKQQHVGSVEALEMSENTRVSQANSEPLYCTTTVDIVYQVMMMREKAARTRNYLQEIYFVLIYLF